MSSEHCRFRRRAAENCEEKTGIATGELGRLVPQGTGPAAASPYGGLRYLCALPLPDGGWRVYYEATRTDGAHDLRTELHADGHLEALVGGLESAAGWPGFVLVAGQRGAGRRTDRVPVLADSGSARLRVTMTERDLHAGAFAPALYPMDRS